MRSELGEGQTSIGGYWGKNYEGDMIVVEHIFFWEMYFTYTLRPFLSILWFNRDHKIPGYFPRESSSRAVCLRVTHGPRHAAFVFLLLSSF